MVEIKRLSKKIKSEIHDAEEYARDALSCKESDKATGDLYYELAEEELGHMEKLHNRVVKMINTYKAEKGNPPPDMQARYDYVHEEMIDAVKEVKILLAMYKG